MTEEKKKISAAQSRAVNKYISNHYERFSLLLPPGMKDRIRAAAMPGESINAFINRAILQLLDQADT